MKSKRFTEEQIIGILKQAQAGMKIVDLCRIVASMFTRTFQRTPFPAEVKAYLGYATPQFMGHQ